MTREAWTDERLDDLSTRVDNGFARTEARFDRMEARFDRVEARFDAMQRTMIQGGFVVIAALVGLIATQL